MDVSLGETLRQLRRHHSLTQTELGDEEFSKSYVSAVERDKVIPSYEAMRFFARKLEQPVEQFEQLLQQAEKKNSVIVSVAESTSLEDMQSDQEIVALLELVLKAREHTAFPLELELNLLQTQIPFTSALQKQGLYSFLNGLRYRELGEESEALLSLERALVLAPKRYHPVILDELGLHFFGKKEYKIALQYYQRALHLLDGQNNDSSGLRLQIELHCGHCYSVLDEHAFACEHYTLARKMLRSTHNMRLAAELYLGLGFCTYAGLYQNAAFLERGGELKSIEHTFRLALGYLLQSRTLYQVSSDTGGEMSARLLQATVLLDHSDWNEAVAREVVAKKGRPFHTTSNTLLDEAEEQCRQLLLYWSEKEGAEITGEVKASLYTTLATLISVFCQRAKIARLNEYVDTALRERLMAVYLCQQTLDTLTQPELFWPLIIQAARLSLSDVALRLEALPRLPDPTQCVDTAPPFENTVAEMFFVAGEVAEEQAHREENSEQFTEECFECGNKGFQIAIRLAAGILKQKKQDAGYFSRFYQRYMRILEQRYEHKAFEEIAHPLLLLETLKNLQPLF